MKTIQEIEEICKKLKPIIGDDADKLWYMYLAEDEKGRKNAILDIEIIAEKVLKNTPLSDDTVLLPPPSQNKTPGSFLLGNVIYKNKELYPLYLQQEDFIKQVGIFAVTGEGKTNLAFLLAIQLLKNKIPFLVIDWKRSWRNLLSLSNICPELKNIHVFTIGREVLPFHWNPFRAPPDADKQLWISSIAESLEKSHLSGPGVAFYFNKIYSTLVKELNNSFYPNFFDGLKSVEKMKAYERELRWKQTTLRIFQSFTIGNVSHVFNTRNPIHLEHLLNKPVILELDLELPKAMRIFFTEIILRWIHLYRLSQGETENLRHVLFLEEVHNLFTSSKMYGVYQDSNSIENIYREIRAFGQGIVSITQHPSLLPIYLLGNCHAQIFLGLQHEDDIRTARKSLFLKQNEEIYLNKLQIGESIVKIKNRINSCLVKIPYIPIQKELINDNWLKVNTPRYLPELLVNKHHNPPSHLPSDINKIKKQIKYPQNAINKPFLIDIIEHPFSSTTQRYKKLNLNPKYGNKYKNHLISQGYIQPKKIITKEGRITLFDITKKGKILLSDLGYEIKELREGIVHKFWKKRAAAHYKKQGYKVLIEENINGRPDIIAEKDKKQIAIEIETGKSNAIKNIQRDLKAGFDEVIAVATNKNVEEKIKQSCSISEISKLKIKIVSVIINNEK